uniref:CesA-2 n=1 Tax=Arundo donax TaxID=35708 RepID=A0A0A9G6U2_ARUDO
MMMRVLMIWTMNSTMLKAMTKVHSATCRGKEKMLISLHLLD